MGGARWWIAADASPGLSGALRRPFRSEKFYRGRNGGVDRPRRIAELCARLRGVEEHMLSGHPHFGQAGTRRAARDCARKRLCAERKAERDSVRNSHPGSGHPGNRRKSSEKLLERQI